MKNIKLYALCLMATVAMFGCSKYDDTELRNDIDDLKSNTVTVGFDSYEIVDAVLGLGCPNINVIMPDIDSYTSIMAKIECRGGTDVDIETRALGSAWKAEIVKGDQNKVSIKITPSDDVKIGDVAILTVSVITKTGAQVSASRTIKVSSTPITPSGDTYTITSLSQFGWVLSQIDAIANFSTGKTFELSSDLDLTGCTLKPIGAKDDGGYNVFKGTFDGKNHTIKGVDINRKLNMNVGFFSAITGVVENLNIEGDVVNDYVDGTKLNIYTGGIVGFNSTGKIINCSFKGSVNSYNVNHTGGIVGINLDGLILGCHYVASEGDFVRSNGPSNPESSRGYTGGIVGYNFSSTADACIIGCSNTGRVKGTSRAGGIVGENFGAVPKYAMVVGCYNQGMVSVEIADTEVGGIAAAIGDGSIIQACYNTGKISGDKSTTLGGIIGRNVFHNEMDLLNTNYWLIDSAPEGYTNMDEDQVVDCVSKSEAELNSQVTVSALNTAIAAWNTANGNLCNYKFAIGTKYPILVKD